MTDLRIPARVVGSIDAEVDGQRVVLSPRDFAYFGMEGTGAPIWDLIDGQRTVDQIVAALEQQFDAPEPTIRTEALAFLDSLVGAGLVADLGTAPPSGS